MSQGTIFTRSRRLKLARGVNDLNSNYLPFSNPEVKKSQQIPQKQPKRSFKASLNQLWKILPTDGTGPVTQVQTAELGSSIPTPEIENTA